MKEVPFTVVRREDLNPLCPHCNQTLTEVYTKWQGAGWFLFPRNSIYFCPHCRKVLGFGQSRMV